MDRTLDVTGVTLDQYPGSPPPVSPVTLTPRNSSPYLTSPLTVEYPDPVTDTDSNVEPYSLENSRPPRLRRGVPVLTVIVVLPDTDETPFPPSLNTHRSHTGCSLSGRVVWHTKWESYLGVDVHLKVWLYFLLSL